MKLRSVFCLLLLCLCLLSSCQELLPPKDSTSSEEESTSPEKPPETTTPETTTPDPEIPKKRIAITFDDGPSRQGLTEKLVDEFQKYGGRATLFVLGNLIYDATGESLAYAAEKGFEIGIHGYTHDIYFDTCAEQDFFDELRLTKEAIEHYINSPVTLLRPPGGRITRERATASGYPMIFWSIDSEDWRYRDRADEEMIRTNVDTIVENVLRDVQDGDIILMHEIYTNSFEATCLILERLDEMGFEFVTVTELLGEENLTAGAYIYSQTQIK